MTSRERVIKTINHEKTDRMPIDLGVHFSTGISAFAYRNLREYLGLSTDNIEMTDCVQLLARVDYDILERFHIDTVLLNPTWTSMHRWNPRDGFYFNVPDTFNPKKDEKGGWQIEFNGEKLYMPPNGYFFDGGWPDFYNLPKDEKIKLFAKNAERIYKETDKFTMLMGFSGFFGGIDFACDMLTDPEDVMAQNEILLKEQIAYFDKVNAVMGKYINSIEINSDLGTQNALMCTPQSYEETVFPYLKKFCEHVHNTSDIKIFMHSCGAIYEAMEYICEAGVDAINPVQISANNMDPKRLKDNFGDRICFWGGGCDTQTVLWSKNADEVRKCTKELIDIFKPSGGFVFNQVHNIMGNVPPENIVAMYDTAYETSFYNNVEL